LIDTLKCEFSQVLNRTVLVDFTFAAGVKQINALDRFLVKLFYLTNPVSTQPTDSIEISFVD